MQSSGSANVHITLASRIAKIFIILIVSYGYDGAKNWQTMALISQTNTNIN